MAPPEEGPLNLRLSLLMDFVGAEFRIPFFMTCNNDGASVDPVLSAPLAVYGVEFVLKVGWMMDCLKITTAAIGP